MTTIRRRKPKFEFAQLLNAVLRDYRVSWRARGLLAELLSYPADYEISVDELVRKAKRQGGNVEGREAMRTAARELKAVGYIIETRHQDKQGKWRTELEVTDDPMYELLLTNQDDSAGQTDAQKSVVGSPGVGFPGVSPNTEKNTETNTSPPAPPERDRPGGHDAGPGREDDDLQDDQTPASPSAGGATGAGEATGTLSDAEALVDDAVRRWRSRHRAPGARDRQRLTERVQAELETGGDETVILDELTRDLGDVRSAVGVVLGARTREPGWGRSADPRPDYSRYEPSGPRPVWCGVCDERTRHVAFERGDGSEGMRRCRRCHPARQGQDDVEQADGSRSSGEETSPPAPVAKVADVDHGQDDGEREGVDVSEVLGILGGDHQAADDGGEEASLPAAEASVAELRRRISVGGAAGEAAGRELSRRLLAAG